MAARSRRQEMDLTTGSVFKKLFIYAVPFMFTNILQILFNATDIAVVGIMVNDDAVAAVGANSALSGLLVNFFISLSIGSNVVLARYVGARNIDSAKKNCWHVNYARFGFGIFLAYNRCSMRRTFFKIDEM